MAIEFHPKRVPARTVVIVKAGKTRLLAIGEVMAETKSIGDGNFAIGFAGDTYNTAVYAARQLGVVGAVSYFTRIGADPLSVALMDRIFEEGIDSSHVVIDPDRNIGIYSVSTDTHGERSFHYWRADSAARRLFTVEETAISMPQADIIYLSGISLAILTPVARQRLINVLASRRAEGAKIAFDSNYRPKLWEDAMTARSTMQAIWEIADFALPSIDDEMVLFGDASEEAVIDRFAKKTWQGIAIKRGVRGPLSLHLAADEHPDFPSARIVVDTTAAGDSFNGGYLAACLEGAGEVERLLAGHELASRVVGVNGAIIPR